MKAKKSISILLVLTMIFSMFISAVPVSAVGDIKIMGISIVDSDNKAILDGVTLSISVNDGDGVETTITDGFGNPALADLTVDDTFTVSITAVPEGYKLPGAITLTAGTSSEEGVYNYVYNGESIDPVHSLTVTLEAEEPTEPTVATHTVSIKSAADKSTMIAGATVQLTDELADGLENWTSTEEPYELSYTLEAGRVDPYCIRVATAPEGYVTTGDYTQWYVGTPVDTDEFYYDGVSVIEMYLEPDTHTHAICGEDTCTTDHNLDGEADGVEVVEYTALSSVLTLDEAVGTYSGSLTGGNYYLDKDIDLGSKLIISGEINLCLNGHKLALASGVMDSIINNDSQEATLTLADCNGDNGSFKFTDSGEQWKYDENGTFTVEGGVITGGYSTKTSFGSLGAAIEFRYGNATLHMYGGNIVGNYAPYCGSAVRMGEGTNAFYMYDGTIQGNYSSINICSTVMILSNEGATIYGGLIANNRYNGGVNSTGIVDASRKVTMLGGEIRDNSGAAVSLTYIEGTNGGFIMQGGSITGNTRAINMADDRNVKENIITLGGDSTKTVKITNNGNDDGTSNIYLRGGEYTIAVNEMAEDSIIGITTSTTPTADSPVTLSTTGAAYASNFTSDNTAYKIAASGDGLVLKVIDTEASNVTIADSIENGTVTTDKSTALEDEVVTLTVNVTDGYITEAITVTDDVNGNEIAVERKNGTEYTFTMPFNAVTVNATFAELPPHNHPECGTECDGDCGVDAGTHVSATWEPLTQAKVEEIIDTYGSNNLGGYIPGKFYLAEDIVLESINIVCTSETYICLNGKTLTIKDISTNGTVHLCDCVGGGKLSGSSDVVDLGFISLLEMYGGTIEARDGQALVVDYSKASVYGGTITSNSKEAINVESGNTIRLSGDLNVSGQEADVVLANSATITLVGAINTATPIVISAGEGVFTSGWSTYMADADPAAYFVTTNPDVWTVQVNADGELEVVGIPQDVTVDDTIVNGSITVSPSGAVSGETVTIVVKPDSGFVLDEITVTDKDGNTVEVTKKDETENEYTFVMPETEVTVGATFAQLYAVTIGGKIENGTVTADKTEAEEGETVTLTLTPDATYEFGTLTVTDGEGNTVTTTEVVTDSGEAALFALPDPTVKTFTFAMPASEVTVDATFTRMSIESPFTVEAVVSTTTPVADRDTAEADMDVYSGDQVYIDIVVNSSDATTTAYTKADWTLIYDSSKFKYVETKTNSAFAEVGTYTLDASNASKNILSGEILANAGNSTKNDEFATGAAVVTYVFEALPQNAEKTGTFGFESAHAYTYEMAGIQDDTPAATTPVDVTIILVDENAPAEIPTGSITNKETDYNALEQAGNEYVLDEQFKDATVTYAVYNDGEEITDTADADGNGVADALEGLTFRTGLPTWKNVGTYTYYVKVSGNGLATIYASATLTISPATLTPSATFAVDPSVNKVTFTPVLEGVLDGTHNGTVTVKYTDATGTEQTETLNASDFVYDGESTSVYNGAAIEVEAEASGTFTVTLDYTEGTDDNYTGGENTATVDVDKITAPADTAASLEAAITSVFPYDSNEHSVEIDTDALAAITDGTWTVSSITDAYDKTKTNPTVKNVGDDRLVKVVFADSTGVYNEVVVYVVLKVTPAEVVITVGPETTPDVGVYEKAVGADDPTFNFGLTLNGTDNGQNNDTLFGSDDLGVELVRVPGEAAGTYTITASYVPNENYNITVNDGKLEIGAPATDGENPQVKIEVVDLSQGGSNGDATPDYIAGKRLILVYTDLDKAYYGYGDDAETAERMFDVTAAGYKYVDNDYTAGTYEEDTKEYRHVYGIVVDKIDTYAATEDYEQQYLDKVIFLGSDAEDAPENIVYDADINLTSQLDTADYSMADGIYNVDGKYDRATYIRSILKADYDGDKVVNTTDSKAVKDVVRAALAE